MITPYSPIPAHRIHPREMDLIRYNDLHGHHFWARENHYFGHRIKRLPPRAVRHTYFGRYYWFYDDIWYCRHNGYYHVCRPPFGHRIAVRLVLARTFRPVRISYYATTSYTYDLVNTNYQELLQQNEIIAKNNEIIAQQQAIIANNETIIAQQQAQIAAGNAAASTSVPAPRTHTIDQANNTNYSNEAYNICKELGLVQTFADANKDYYYQDGVFYTIEDEDYVVVVPPAGARVENLPEDYDLITLKDGMEYYKVDDTVYMITMNDDKAYFEVLGQLYE